MLRYSLTSHGLCPRPVHARLSRHYKSRALHPWTPRRHHTLPSCDHFSIARSHLPSQKTASPVASTWTRHCDPLLSALDTPFHRLQHHGATVTDSAHGDPGAMSTPSSSLYHQRFDPRLQSGASSLLPPELPCPPKLMTERSLLRRLFYIPSSAAQTALERAGVPGRLAWKAFRRMRTQHAAHAYAAAVGEYAQHAASITWIVRSAPGVTEYQALCALRAFPDPAEARDHVLHQTHRAAWAGCRFCEREAAERARRYSAISAVGTSGHAALPVDGERADEYPPPCPPAVGITPATPIVPSRPLTPASR